MCTMYESNCVDTWKFLRQGPASFKNEVAGQVIIYYSGSIAAFFARHNCILNHIWSCTLYTLTALTTGGVKKTGIIDVLDKVVKIFVLFGFWA